ncbi:conjugal transfer transcriptional regulator TraJ [Xylophilus ampelinus]|uniref:TraJ protein n=1 Tax=Xylophilus ampelinus TaxID=54067 RepID=A0A318SCQ6_9BURK|nr:conjugal transfer transcriptional regulator TraJ [Xylophilus ampelinus]PYE73382.1 hypothetical protein DFQ15_13610 [Xylophilus ampelinus]
MTDDSQKITRKNSPPIKVYCLPEERAEIEANAKRAGVSVARYLRDVGQGYQIKVAVDTHQHVRELVRVNGDLGRLGGLLKLWLTDDVRTLQFGEATILALLGRIEATQDEMSRIMKSVVQPRVVP